MNRFWTFLTDVRVLSVLGFAALAAFLFLGADALEIALVWAGVVLGIAFAAWSLSRLVRWALARRASRRMEQALDDQTEQVRRAAPPKERAEIDTLRNRLREAVRTIKSSRLGQTTGSAALYELPWYIVIGNPAAGKSTAIVKSGLKFPFADQNGNVVTGVGGTRNCDWFFTTEGILLDTAGRYAVHEEDRSEWLGFLSLLKRHRAKAPINGILIAASIGELASARPEAAILLAKNLRQRVQELTESLEVLAPVYLVFTKADLIAGFTEFFEDRDRAERERVWGATLPYDPLDKSDAVSLFDRHFDELFDGLKEMSVARMSLHRGQALPPGVLTFPLEFAAMKPALRAFVATLFEDNPYQYPPIFRGFYFTSALQEGSASSRASAHVANRFALNNRPEHTTAMVAADNGFFLRDLFSRVIFADRNLVRQYTSRNKLRARTLTFGAAVAVLALALGGWTWAYFGNRQLVAHVKADLDQAIAIQKDKFDLASRIKALEVLANRIEQLEGWRGSRPLSIGLGLYQGEAIVQKLHEEYFNGIRQVLVEPAAQGIEAYLRDADPGGKPAAPGAAAGGGRFDEPARDSVDDAYNALKAYLMLADPARREPGHLRDQLTRFWRGWLAANRGSMPEEDLLRGAGLLLDFAVARAQERSFPQVQQNHALVEQARAKLSRQMRGKAAHERVYTDIKTRAATRFQAMTVVRIVGEQDRDVLVGSHVVPGTFTREAWQGYVEEEFKKAATTTLRSADWVLGSAISEDLTLQGSPEQIRKQLTDLYKKEYADEWKRFVQGIAVERFGSFETAVARMNRLGDPVNSPMKRVLQTIYDQTSWDNPSLLNERLGTMRRSVLDWIKQVILRQAPSQVDVNVKIDGPKAEITMGPIGKEFAVLARLMMTRDNSPTLVAQYLDQLSKLRTRFNRIRTEGDPGPGARKLLADTLASSGSELAEALRFVDEQMVAAAGKETLRPLLVRPLMQGFEVLVEPTEVEINRVWQAQVFDPFQRTLAGKYPFDEKSKIEAGTAEIAKLYGPDGAIAKFAGESLGPLVNRRGDSISPRVWGDASIRLRPEFTAGFGGWVAPLEGPAQPGESGGPTFEFEIQPQGAPGLQEYTLEIDGQKLRYRMGAQDWMRFVWPRAGVVQGARISAITLDGRPVEVVNEPGQNGWRRLTETARLSRVKEDPSLLEFAWGTEPVVSLRVRMVKQPGPVSSPGTPPSRPVVVKLPTLVAGVGPAAAAAAVPGASAASGASR